MYLSLALPGAILHFSGWHWVALKPEKALADHFCCVFLPRVHYSQGNSNDVSSFYLEILFWWKLTLTILSRFSEEMHSIHSGCLHFFKKKKYTALFVLLLLTFSSVAPKWYGRSQGTLTSEQPLPSLWILNVFFVVILLSGCYFILWQLLQH